jgi:hypothetical protein
MVMNCDTLLMIGSSFPSAEWLPEEGSARGVEVNIDGTLICMRYPMDAHLVGDSKETLKQLIPLSWLGTSPGPVGLRLPAKCSQREQTELMRVVVARISQDGTMRRRMVDTVASGDVGPWEELASRALPTTATAPPQGPRPGNPAARCGSGWPARGPSSGSSTCWPSVMSSSRLRREHHADLGATLTGPGLPGAADVAESAAAGSQDAGLAAR